MSDQACSMYSLVSIPLYDTLGPEACCYVINQSKCTFSSVYMVNSVKRHNVILLTPLFIFCLAAELKVVLCDKAEKAQALLNDAEKTPSLKYIVVFESVSNNNMEIAQNHGITLMSLTQLEDEGRQHLIDPRVGYSVYDLEYLFLEDGYVACSKQWYRVTLQFPHLSL